MMDEIALRVAQNLGIVAGTEEQKFILDSFVSTIRGSSMDEQELLEEIPQEVRKALANPENVFGRFVLVQKLGEGAMGVVHKAYDAQLYRYVALKFLKSGQAEEIKSEARLLAGLEHKNIARIYDIASFKGVWFVSMQFIEGSVVSFPWSVEQLPLMATICEAVDFAHKKGVVHRDIKPDNIMTDSQGNPFVMDFGIATKKSVEGEIAGTPGFMAPEIAEGRPATVQSDIYSLAATLYFLMQKKSPVDLSDCDSLSMMFERIRNARIVPLSSSVPRELAAIIKKGLDANPAQRYPSAAEMAQDLRNFLTGQPVQAYGTSFAYKLKKAVIRKSFAVGIAVVMCIIAVAAYLQRQRAESAWQENRRLVEAFLEQCIDLTDKVKKKRIEGARRAEYMPYLETARSLYESTIAHRVQDKEICYRMGLLYRIVGGKSFEPEAMKFQDMALKVDPDFAPSLFEKAILLYHQYRKRIDNLREMQRFRESQARSTPRFYTDARLEEFEARSGKPISMEIRHEVEKLLQRVSNQFVHARAVLLAMQSKNEEAAAILEDVVSRDSANEECYRWLAEVSLKAKQYDKALHWYTKGIEAVKGSEILHFLRGVEYLNRLALLFFTNKSDLKSGEAAFNSANADFSRAIDLDDKNVDAYLRRGGNCANWIHLRQSSGQDVTGLYEKVIADLNRGVELDPANEEALVWRGMARVNEAIRKMGSGQDADKDFEEALLDFKRVVELFPAKSIGFLWQGFGYFDSGSYRMKRGLDPSLHLNKALNCFSDALKKNASDALAYKGRGLAQANLATHLKDHGKDPEERYSAAIADFKSAVKIDKNDYDIYRSMGVALANWGTYEMERGRDAENLYKNAVEMYDEANSLHNSSYDVWLGRGNANMNWAMLLEKTGRDAAPRYTAALEDFQKAADLNPNDCNVWIGRGDAHLNFGHCKSRGGQDPVPMFNEAIASYDRAISLNRKDYDAWESKATVMIHIANHKQGRGEDPTDDYNKAVELCSEAIKLNETNFESWMHRGDAKVCHAVHMTLTGADADEKYTSSIDDYTRAIRFNGKSHKAWEGRASARMNWANFRKNRGQDSDEMFALALADMDESLKLNEANFAAWKGRGMILANRSHGIMIAGKDVSATLRDSLESFDRALKLNPVNFEVWTARGNAVGTLLVARINGTAESAPGEKELYAELKGNFEKAIALNSADVEPRWRRGSFAYVAQDYDQAVADFETAARLNPASVTYFKSLWEKAKEKLSGRDY